MAEIGATSDVGAVANTVTASLKLITDLQSQRNTLAMQLAAVDAQLASALDGFVTAVAQQNTQQFEKDIAAPVVPPPPAPGSGS